MEGKEVKRVPESFDSFLYLVHNKKLINKSLNYVCIHIFLKKLRMILLFNLVFYSYDSYLRE